MTVVILVSYVRVGSWVGAVWDAVERWTLVSCCLQICMASFTDRSQADRMSWVDPTSFSTEVSNRYQCHCRTRN